MSDGRGPARSGGWTRRSALVAIVVAGALTVTGCGPSDDVTALAVAHPRWIDDVPATAGLSLRFDTECAEVSKASVEADAGVDGIPLVTVWGHPQVGRCRTEVVVTVPAGTTRIEDAATGMVVDLPAP